MQSRRSAGAVMFLVGLFILQSASQLAINEVSESEMIDDVQRVERVHFELRDEFSMKLRALTNLTISLNKGLSLQKQ